MLLVGPTDSGCKAIVTQEKGDIAIGKQNGTSLGTLRRFERFAEGRRGSV